MADTQPPPGQKPPGQALGKGMLIIGWLMVLGVLSVVFGTWEEKQYNPNQQLSGVVTDEFREITLEANRFHHYVANGSINGKPVTFLVDTGATDVVIPAALGRDLGLVPGARGMASTANGLVEVRATEIAELRLGSLVFYDVRASLNPGMEDDEILLGMSALRQVEMTQKNNQLILKQLLGR